VAVLLVEEHLLHLLLELWVLLVVVGALTALRQEQVLQVESVIQAHLRLLLEQT
jgi:hypothetical protein